MRTALLFMLLAACDYKPNYTKPDAFIDYQAAPDAMTVMSRAVVVAGDFNPGHPGVLSALDVTTKTMNANLAPAQSIGSDPVVRRIGGELFVINRADGNNVTILDAGTFQLVEQMGTGASSNPQDVAIVSDKLYVAAFGTRGILELTRGSTETVEIDLSADDPDGKPNCNSIYRSGDKLYVSCELLDDTQQFLPPRGNGKVYVVDPATRSIEHSITLSTVNPFGMFEELPLASPYPGHLVIPTVSFADGSGCVERIVTGEAPAAAGCVITNAQLGGFVSRVAPQVVPGAVLLRMAVPAPDFIHANLRTYDLNASTLWTQAMTPQTQVIGDLAPCPTGELVVSDTSPGAAGLRVYRGTAEQTANALPVGLVPWSSHGLVCY
ncbi:MAG: YncE family protein [Kofleriaceae bacterium]